MPQLAAASSRDRPSKTSAIASIRRAALASRVRAASRRKSPADRSRRVIATAMSASAPGQWRSESRRPPKRGHVRVIGQGAWYENMTDLRIGTDGDDVFTVGADRAVSFGGAGDDSLTGGAENDVLYGEDGDDTLVGNAGADVLDAGNGDDSVNTGTGDDVVVAGDGDDTVVGMAGSDLVLAGAAMTSLPGTIRQGTRF